jgi:UDP-N-acetyl-D-mannosaminuronic acid transferase (WecB/TagA/CpsF family)
MSNQLQTTNSLPLRCNVLGVSVSAINMTDAVRCCEDHIQQGHRGYVCVTGVHGVMVAQNDLTFQKILNSSLFLCHIALQLTGIRRYKPQIPLYASSCITSSGTESRSCQ